MSYSLKTFFIYLALGFTALAIAALLNVPALYYPLFFSGLFLALALLHLLGWLLKKNWPDIYHAGMALLPAILGLGLLYLQHKNMWADETPEPIRLGLLGAAMLEGGCFTTAIFAALDARNDRISAGVAFLLAISGLFLLGYFGIDDYLSKAAAASTLGTIFCLVGEIAIERLNEHKSNNYHCF